MSRQTTTSLTDKRILTLEKTKKRVARSNGKKIQQQEEFKFTGLIIEKL
jgi:hypothetical protein